MTPTAASVGRLVVCPTPIGNLEDVTLRVLATLGRADVVACEDTRHTRVLLDRHGIGAAGLVSLHEHNERARAGELLERIRAGALVALVSDAGMPLVSDPGYVVVRECIAAGLPLEVLPGPSATLTALVASGLPAERWRFVGFLPRAGGELRELLGGAGETLVAFESPRRLAGTLELLADLDAERPAAVCRELTKLHEEVRRGTAAQLAAHYRGAPARGEVVVVVGAARARAADARATGEAVAAVDELVRAGAKPRAAAGAVARLTGLRANELYRALTGGGAGGGT
ncbi:MAG TPA: 16S rRNA (cytidine(1402)-2'-O)-methyltransferase [Solirubrobacteraceae bacterium]|jgi:16S rRNA (cytidine1402-2'-O)-methyltransferase|nr:16S rRNA (cytidine(1402)-2'-O)-methyltransferase [Solirubrobacteraceae bacterium]